MRHVPVFYATTEGHTRLIAEALASTLRQEGMESEAIALPKTGRVDWIDWADVGGVIVGASVHAGKHQSSVGAFVAREADRLNRCPSVFFSVSMAAASKNATEVDAARAIATKFVGGTTWRPDRVVCFAGKLAYTKYGWLTRWIMRRIAAKEGGPTDTSRDHDFTDWHAVRALAVSIAAEVRDRHHPRVA